MDDKIAALTEQLAQLSGVDKEKLTAFVRTVKSVENDAIIKLNVGGEEFQVKQSTLVREPESMLGAMFSGRYDLMQDEHGTTFIDRDPTHFGTILSYLRNGRIEVPEDEDERIALLREADYYSLEGLIDLLGGPVDSTRYFHESTLDERREEDRVRQLFFADEIDESKIADPYIHLVNVYDNVESFRFPDSPAPALYPVIMDEPDIVPRHPGELSVAPNLRQFKKQFNALTADIFQGFKWDKFFVAGGIVLGGLMPVPVASQGDLTKYYLGQKRPYFRYDWEGSEDSGEDDDEDEDEKWRRITRPESTTYINSDIDLFLYGVTEKQALAKIDYLYKHLVKVTNNRNVVVVRTQRTITMVPQWPWRNVQIILRLYKSPAEVLLGFDVDCVGVGYDGNNVWAMPRARRALTSGVNIADPTRQTFRTATYEHRLYKYSKRGFAVAIPGFDRHRIDPSLYSKDYTDIHGLARLLFLENRDKIKKVDPVKRTKLLLPSIGFESDLNLDSSATLIEQDLGSQRTEYDHSILLPFNPMTSYFDVLKSLRVRINNHWKQCLKDNVPLETFVIFGRTLNDIKDSTAWIASPFAGMRTSRFPTTPTVSMSRQIEFVKSLKEYVGTLSETPDDWYQDARYQP